MLLEEAIEGKIFVIDDANSPTFQFDVLENPGRAETM